MLLEKNFATLLNLRLEERNRQLQGQFLEVKERLNARGILFSSITVSELHTVAETELKESATIIATTAIDVISSGGVLLAKKRIRALCPNALEQRKNYLEGQLRSAIQTIKEGLSSDKLVASFLSLDALYPLLQEEMRIKLSQAYATQKRRDGNVFQMIGNRILDHLVSIFIGIASFLFLVFLQWLLE